MTATQRRVVNATLSNDENSTDAELLEYFTSEIGITTAEAEAAITKRFQDFPDFTRFEQQVAASKETTAALFTRSANGLQAWPEDRTTIGIPARCTVLVGSHPVTGDSAIQVLMGDRRDDLALYIPRGGSVVIEA